MNKKRYPGLPLSVYVLPLLLMGMWNYGLFAEEYDPIISTIILVLIIVLGIDVIISIFHKLLGV